MARHYRHPDALWLASLFPAGTSREDMRDVMLAVMLAQGDDPRALYVAWELGERSRMTLLVRAAHMGYARAQAHLAFLSPDPQRLLWAEKAGLQGDRYGILQLAFCCHDGRGCAKDKARAVELFRMAAELEYPSAAYFLGLCGYGNTDWERVHWWGRARFEVAQFCNAVLRLLPSFEKGENGRILYVAAAAIAKGLDVARCVVYGQVFREGKIAKLQRVIECMMRCFAAQERQFCVGAPWAFATA
jgi:hypothetical protein